MMKPGKRSFTFEFKLEVVRRFVDGGVSALELAREYDLSSPKLVEGWVRSYRRDGEEALRPKPKAVPPLPRTRPGSASWSGCGQRTCACRRRTPT
ncbi:helix-turn-helix protein [Lentzea atacamensis]|uniref:Helix-turn-helix protein n=1 Tax=Lentzea atacamensis TaxID=531938 RepID=A0ABX9DZM9_9PSEU|nr:helix-turn-helix domain-containing protein [Lentzea atacamensis]RAS61310.1 helix-turn-helix protein [Lentzea atacamensis]